MGHEGRLEAELKALRRIARRRKMLELPATIYAEQAPKECIGDCREPTKLGVLGLTCCHFRMRYEEYHDTLRMETLQRQRLERVRTAAAAEQRRAIEGSPLQHAYYRDFTGTGVHRRLSGGEPDEGDPEDNQQSS